MSIKETDVPKLVTSILVCLGAGIIGSLFTKPTISSLSTYKQVIPWRAPPNWVLSPLWITLFILMGISLYLVWHKGLTQSQVRLSVALFAAQLVLCILWSAAFFGVRSWGGWEALLYEIIEVILWIFILLTILNFYEVSPTAACLLIPYFALVSAAVFDYYLFLILS